MWVHDVDGPSPGQRETRARQAVRDSGKGTAGSGERAGVRPGRPAVNVPKGALRAWRLMESERTDGRFRDCG